MEFVDEQKTMTVTATIYYNFNDPVTDVQAIKNGTMTDVEVMSDEKVERQINRSGVKGVKSDKLSYAYNQGDKKMDYGVSGYDSHDLNENTFYVRKGTAYNLGDIGNYLWGRGMAELGISLPIALSGADYNNMTRGKAQKTAIYDMGPGTYGSPGFFDSQADQRAITKGYYSSPKQKSMINNKSESLTKSIYLN